MNPNAELPRPHGEGPPVPPLWQADFDEAALEQLFVDLATAAEVLSVRGKVNPVLAASPEPLDLGAARDQLFAGVLTGVQIRYRFDGHEWVDTVLRNGPTFRLIRCRVPGV
jgi:hypothetical protein